MLSENLSLLRKRAGLTQEQAAAKIGVSRQALSKWESGDSQPDLENSMALAELYDVSLDDLVRFDQKKQHGLEIPPKGKHSYGVLSIGENGEVRLPEELLRLFSLKPGDDLLLLADENQGIAMVPWLDFCKKQNL